MARQIKTVLTAAHMSDLSEKYANMAAEFRAKAIQFLNSSDALPIGMISKITLYDSMAKEYARRATAKNGR